MPDTMTSEQRHKCMSRIRARDTKPEMIVRRWLWAEGWRVLVVWECMLKPKTREAMLRALSQRLNSIFLESVRKPKPYTIEEDSGYMIAAEPEMEYGKND